MRPLRSLRCGEANPVFDPSARLAAARLKWVSMNDATPRPFTSVIAAQGNGPATMARREKDFECGPEGTGLHFASGSGSRSLWHQQKTRL